MPWVTAEVSAGCYPRTNSTSFLSHRAFEDPKTGYITKVGCKGVKPASILPDSSCYTQEVPTCKACARAFRKEGR